jgi:hypothetical protein
MSPSAQADLLAKAAEHQNQMLAKLRPMVDAILNAPDDPRSKMMRQFMETLGGMPSPHDVEAMRADVLAGPETSGPRGDHGGIDVESPDDQEPPVDAARWLSDNFESLIPGFIEAAKYAYSRLEEEDLGETESSAYILDDPSDQDYLDRIRILSVEIRSDRRYVFTLEAPASHLEEHGMYAVFEESRLLSCGEYDIVAEFERGAFGEDEE